MFTLFSYTCSFKFRGFPVVPVTDILGDVKIAENSVKNPDYSDIQYPTAKYAK